MYSTADELDADHYSDFLATTAFLFDDKDRVGDLEHALADLRICLTSTGAAGAQQACARIEQHLRSVMVRTERLAATPDRDGMLLEVDTTTSIEPVDVHAYLRLGELAEAVKFHEPTEFWKSSPYLFNFMERYKLKEALELGVETGILEGDLGPGPGLLDWEDVDAYQGIDPENCRLRWLLNDLDSHEAYDLLWIPASFRYYDAATVYERESARTFTKRLLFSGWAVVPKVVSTLVSYEAERRAYGSTRHKYSTEYRARGGRRLDYRLVGDRPAAMTAFLFVWPSPVLAELGDPAGFAASRPPIDRLLDEVGLRLNERLQHLLDAAPTSGPVDQRWYWAAPLLLDQLTHPEVLDDWFGMEDAEKNWSGDEAARGWLRHTEEAWDMLSDGPESLGRVPDDLVEVLAEIAVGGPAICSLRAIARSSGLSWTDPRMLTAAARAAWGFRSFFGAPDVTAVVDGRADEDDVDEDDGRIPYWREAVRHCVGGNLQSVLDEHAHVLRDWLGFVLIEDDEDRVKAAQAIAGRMVEALEIRTSTFRVDIPRQNGMRTVLEERRMRSRFAVAFGNQRLEGGGEARVDSVSAAFNSPFWPFVLTSTSIGQEGLDFHLWCHSVVHWNLPSNPVDLEQREGRVHRYKGHAVRRNIAETLGATVVLDPGSDIWDQLFEEASGLREAEDSEMVPYWVFNQGSAKIERYVPLPPFSRDAAHLPRLRKSLAAYRLAFGQPRQDELLEFLGEHHDADELLALCDTLRIDLSPPS